MKKCVLILFLIPLIISCNHKNKEGSVYSIKKEVLDVAIKYARGKFTTAKETVDASGVVTIQDSVVNVILTKAYQIKYVIDPSKIKYGLIDDDSTTDAIVYMSDINAQDMESPELLILLNTDGKFILNRSIESSMRIIGIKDRIITAEVYTRSINSPLRDCHLCKEVVKYKFKSGDLVRVE
jgi:hypothetical protein